MSIVVMIAVLSAPTLLAFAALRQIAAQPARPVRAGARRPESPRG
jgi:hypothetical protein